MKLKKPKFWDYKRPNIYAYILYPISLLIQIISSLIKIKPKKFNIKTICIGNIYLGGTGKTSLCIKINQILNWNPLFEPYLIHYFKKGGSGADIGPLKNDELVLAGLRPDSQRYFDHHHAANDTFDAVNKRELELGAATMTALIYLIDKYGFSAFQNQERIKD